MYDGSFTPDEMEQIACDDPNADFVPTTQQDAPPHDDGLFGRTYDESFDQGQVGERGTDILNTHEHGDHVDVVEQDPETGKMYHNRVYDPDL
jgi:hypothetical protein